jgi:DNA-binding NtrC family response regulator
MSDLLSLRMLLVSGVAAERDLIRRAAALASLPFELVEHVEVDDWPAVRELIAFENFDLVFLDSRMPRAGRMAAIAAAQAATPRPILILVGPATTTSREVLTDGLEFDAALAKPIKLDEAGSIIARCIRARLPNRVLIVDDSATVRAVIRKVLQASRFQIHAAEADEGRSALEQIRSGRFEFVFLDCNMPGLDGFATLNEIRRSHPQVQVVMITGTRDQRMADRARACGAKAFLFKPFFAKDVDQVMHSLFGLKAPKPVPA